MAWKLNVQYVCDICFKFVFRKKSSKKENPSEKEMSCGFNCSNDTSLSSFFFSNITDRLQGNAKWKYTHSIMVMEKVPLIQTFC